MWMSFGHVSISCGHIDVLGVGIRIYFSGLLRVLGLSSGWESSTSVRWYSSFWVEFGWSSTLQVKLLIALLAATNYKIY